MVEKTTPDAIDPFRLIREARVTFATGLAQRRF